ncbi:M48 family metallopeptidase [uncultured Deinococcus sp.]|uniref:M48 family metallopeptidase n=1 Tax=uncultured Deinococcus sp. TaxID=158789 RepID=UPI0025876155|nr:M48 family metallopeptidase [uncultured Deinococcus sp.]
MTAAPNQSGGGAQGALDQAWQRLADREAARLRDAFVRRPDVPPAARSRVAYALAGAVVLGYAALLLAGLGLLVPVFGPGSGLHPVSRVLLGFVAAALLGYAWQARPRFGPLPGTEVTEAQAPELHRLVREVARALGAARPARLVLIPEVNAFMGHGGLPPRPTLGLGLPLWYGLPPQERVAVLAHELAHDRSGDPARTGLIGAALHMLAQAYTVMQPDSVMRFNPTILELIGNAGMALLAWIPLGLYRLLLELIGADHQRAEFRADLLAAGVAGTPAVATALDRLHLSHLLESALHKQRHDPERPHAFAELRHMWDTVPEEQRQMRRDERAAQRTQLSATHPLTADRLQVVLSHPAGAQLRLDDAWAARIDAELLPFVRPLEAQAYDDYRDRYSS